MRHQLTSNDVADILRTAEVRWMFSALRKRLPDNMRLTWKMRFMARAVTLQRYWNSLYNHPDQRILRGERYLERVPYATRLSRYDELAESVVQLAEHGAFGDEFLECEPDCECVVCAFRSLLKEKQS